MIRNLIVLPDGTEIFSGDVKAAASIQSVKHTETVNDGTELTLGSCCSCMLEATLITPGGALSIAEGTEVTYYRVAEDGTRTKLGLYTLAKPQRKSAARYALTAYDRVSWLDKDLSPWLYANQGMFPVSLYSFAAAVCAQCGLTLANASISNGSWQIQAFYADDLTGRQLMRWVGEACGRFVRATADGKIELAWYTDKRGSESVAPYDGSSTTLLMSHDGTLLTDSTGALLVLDTYGTERRYYAGGLSYEDYRVSLVDKAVIRQGSDDVGVVYPPTSDSANGYVIDGNYLLTTDSEAALQPVAQTLYTQLRSMVRYTPLTVSTPAQLSIRAGDIISVQDARGRWYDTYVMTRTTSGGKDTLESTGSISRDCSTARNGTTLKNLSGKVLRLQTSVDGLRIEAAELSGDFAALTLTVEGLSTEVGKMLTTDDLAGYVTTTEMTSAITQSAESIKLEVNKTLTNYATTTEMTSAINQRADAITLEVSKSYTAKGGVRAGFAGESSSISITSGCITFASGTVVIDAANFTLDKNGNVTATGTFKSVSGTAVSEVSSGGLHISIDGNNRANLFRAWNYDAAYLSLTGVLGGKTYNCWYSSDGIALNNVTDNTTPFRVSPQGGVDCTSLNTTYLNGSAVTLMPISIGATQYYVFGLAGQLLDLDTLSGAVYSGAGTAGTMTQTASQLTLTASGSDLYRMAYLPVEAGNYRTLTITYSLTGQYNLAWIGLASNTAVVKSDTAAMGYKAVKELTAAGSGTYTVDISAQTGLMYVKLVLWHASSADSGTLTITNAVLGV